MLHAFRCSHVVSDSTLHQIHELHGQALTLVLPLLLRATRRLRTPAEILLRKTLPGSTAQDLRFGVEGPNSPRPPLSGSGGPARAAAGTGAGCEWLGAVAQLCHECWAHEPEARPSTAEVQRRLRSCIQA